MMIRRFCQYLQVVFLLLSCEKYSPDVFATESDNASDIQVDTTVYVTVEDHPEYTIICGADSTNAKSFARFLSSYGSVLFEDGAGDVNDYEFIIGRTGRPESFWALEAINGFGYIVSTEPNKLIVTGTDETWTAIALYAFEEYCIKSGVAEKDSLLTIPGSLVLKEEYEDPQLLSRLIQRGYTFTIEPEFVLSCPGLGSCTIGQGATSDGEYFYLINKNSNDTQSIIFRYDMQSLKWKGQSGYINAGHSNDLAYNKEKDLIVIAHGLSQGEILTPVRASNLAVLPDVTIGVGASSVSYNEKRKQYAFSQGGTTLHITDDSFHLVGSFKRTPPKGYTAQGMGSDDMYIYFPMSASYDNVIDVYDWDGRFVTTLNLQFALESETLFYSSGEYYMNFNHSGSELYRINPILYYTFD